MMNICPSRKTTRSHLSLSQHKIMSSLPILNALPTINWTCAICSLDMHINSQVSHLAGKKHIARAAALNTSAEPTITVPITLVPAIPSKPASSTTKAPHVPREDFAVWFCTSCKIGMALNEKHSHLAGPGHDARVKANANSKKSKNPHSRTQENAVGYYQGTSAAAHITLVPASPPTPARITPKKPIVPAEGFATWFCITCKTSMPLKHKPHHIASPEHAAKLKSNANSNPPPGKKRNKKPPRYPNENGGSRYHADDGFDSDDARAILYDIDTAFGLLPGGGAYKESDYYDHYGNVIG